MCLSLFPQSQGRHALPTELLLQPKNEECVANQGSFHDDKERAGGECGSPVETMAQGPN